MSNQKTRLQELRQSAKEVLAKIKQDDSILKVTASELHDYLADSSSDPDQKYYVTNTLDLRGCEDQSFECVVGASRLILDDSRNCTVGIIVTEHISAKEAFNANLPELLYCMDGANIDDAHNLQAPKVLLVDGIIRCIDTEETQFGTSEMIVSGPIRSRHKPKDFMVS